MIRLNLLLLNQVGGHGGLPLRQAHKSSVLDLFVQDLRPMHEVCPHEIQLSRTFMVRTQGLSIYIENQYLRL